MNSQNHASLRARCLISFFDRRCLTPDPHRPTTSRPSLPERNPMIDPTSRPYPTITNLPLLPELTASRAVETASVQHPPFDKPDAAVSDVPDSFAWPLLT